MFPWLWPGPFLHTIQATFSNKQPAAMSATATAFVACLLNGGMCSTAGPIFLDKAAALAWSAAANKSLVAVGAAERQEGGGRDRYTVKMEWVVYERALGPKPDQLTGIFPQDSLWMTVRE